MSDLYAAAAAAGGRGDGAVGVSGGRAAPSPRARWHRDLHPWAAQGLGELPEDERPSLSLLASRPARGPDPLASLGPAVVCSRLPGPLMTRAWDLGLLRPGRGSDVVHSVSLAAPLPAKGVPLVLTVHDVAWRSMPEAYPTRGRRWHEAALRRAAARAAAVIVPSEATATAVLAAGVGIGERRLHVVPEGADHLGEPDGPAAQALLDRLGVKGPYLLTVSTLEPRKNLGRLFEAYALARPRLLEPWPLVVVGPSGWGPAPGAPARLGGRRLRGRRRRRACWPRSTKGPDVVPTSPSSRASGCP